VIVHLIDGTYELFRRFYGLRSKGEGIEDVKTEQRKIVGP
jgi:hypothetical protein